MTLWNGSFPFYPGANACFPVDTAWAVIVSIFLSVLATSIIILPGIRGKAVSGGTRSSGLWSLPCASHISSFPASKTDLGSKCAHRVMARALGHLASHGDELQPNPPCTPMPETPNSPIPNLGGTQV